MTILLGIIGLVILVAGAELLVRGASRLAVSLGIAPLIVGLTIVAFGTSAPELAVSLQASLGGENELAVGNVVGSNIFNVLFILGASALIVPLVVAQRLIRIDVPIMLCISVLLLLLSLDGSLGKLDAFILVAGITAYVGYAVYESRSERRSVQEEYSEEFGEKDRGTGAFVRDVFYIVAGLGLLVAGADWLVDAAREVALEVGLSELVVGLTIVAAGTSLPEVATSIVAALKGERDIAVGNVVGSNIFNILAVLGFSSLFSPDPIAVPVAAQNFDIPVMVAIAIACLPVFFTGMIARWQGALFLAFYVAYVAYLILNASEHDALGAYSSVMLLFVLPLSALALLGGYVRHVGAERRARAMQR